MRKGILAQWRRGILARGVAGACMLAIPVAVASAIGFGNGFSGITGGLSSIANGPPTPPDATTTATSPSRLDDAVVALAGPGPADGGTGGGGGGGDGGDGQGNRGTTNTGGGGGSSTQPNGGGDGAGGGGGGVPEVQLPPGGGGGGGGSGDPGGDVVGGLGDTVNGLLGP